MELTIGLIILSHVKKKIAIFIPLLTDFRKLIIAHSTVIIVYKPI